MLIPGTIRWLVKTSLRSPSIWLLLVIIGILWPTLHALMSVGITSQARPPEGALWQLGFLGTITGGSIGMYRLSKSSWWLQRTSPDKRYAVEVCGIATIAFMFLCAAWAVAAIHLDKGGLARGLGVGLLGCLHLALIGSLLLALPSTIAPGLKAALLPAVAWVLPAICPGEGHLSNALRQTCEIARYFEFPSVGESPAHVGIWTLLPIIGLVLLRMAAILTQRISPCVTPSSETSTRT